jgi:hypothetical protein
MRGATSKPSGRVPIGKTTRARSGAKKIGIQPSAISKASSTDYGEIEAR